MLSTDLCGNRPRTYYFCSGFNIFNLLKNSVNAGSMTVRLNLTKGDLKPLSSLLKVFIIRSPESK